MDFVLLLEVYSLEEMARQMDRKQRRHLALELGEKILDRCVGPVDPMAEDTVSLMQFDDVGHAVRLVPGDWFSDEPKVYLWHESPQTARGALTPLQKLTDHDFT